MAGENPDDDPHRRARRIPVEAKWQRFQVLIMGPVMNLRRWRSCCTRSCCTRAPRSRVREQAPVVGGVARGIRRRRRPAFKPGDRILVGRRARRRHWDDFCIAIGTRPESRGRRSASCATASEISRTVTPVGRQSRFEIGDIGVLPERASAARGRSRRASRPTRPASSPATSSSPSNGEPIIFARQLRDAIAKQPEQPIDRR